MSGSAGRPSPRRDRSIQGNAPPRRPQAVPARSRLADDNSSCAWLRAAREILGRELLQETTVGIITVDSLARPRLGSRVVLGVITLLELHDVAVPNLLVSQICHPAPLMRRSRSVRSVSSSIPVLPSRAPNRRSLPTGIRSASRCRDRTSVCDRRASRRGESAHRKGERRVSKQEPEHARYDCGSERQGVETASYHPRTQSGTSGNFCGVATGRVVCCPGARPHSRVRSITHWPK